MKKYIIASIAAACLVLTGCGEKNEISADPPKNAPYVNTAPEVENNEENEKIQTTELEDFLDEIYDREGGFFFKRGRLDELKTLPQNEPVSLSAVLLEVNANDDRIGELQAKVEEIEQICMKAENTESDDISALIKEQKGYLSQIDKIRNNNENEKAGKTYEYFSSLGCPSKLASVPYNDLGKTYSVYYCFVEITPKELWALAEETPDFYLIEPDEETYSLEGSKIIMESSQ
ncbi:MAG: hypothetical protein ACOX68_07840 [Candidatus Limivicinus sp.]